ncbi:MAG: hypothetical protein JNM93_10835, partial [Bacteriovoracaceae bacterium]|nr:hypothetical protein [Bacteriovoracaceae bacterium]
MNLKLLFVSLNLMLSYSAIALGPGATYKYENQRVPRVLENGWKEIVPGHLVYFPQAVYDRPSDKFPVLIFLHGMGECGNAVTDLGELEIAGPPKRIKAKNWHATGNKTQELIVVAPQLMGPDANNNCISSGGWYSIKGIYDFVIKNYPADPNRIYLTGLSLGGMGVYNALTNVDVNDKFAAVIPVAGRESTSLSPYCADIKNVALWAFHGDKDTIVSYGQGKASVEDMNKCNPYYPAKLTTYAGVYHDSWTKTYDNAHASSNIGADGSVYTDIYAWLQTFSLDGTLPNPPQEPVNNAPTMAAISNVVLDMDTQKTVNINSEDQDGDSLALTFAQALPSFMQLVNTGNGDAQIILNPKASDVGSYNVTAITTDPDGLSAQQSFSVTVNQVVTNPPSTGGTEPVIHVQGQVKWGGFTLWCPAGAHEWACAEDVSNGGNNKVEFEIKKRTGNQVTDFALRLDDGSNGVKEVIFNGLTESYQKFSI